MSETASYTNEQVRDAVNAAADLINDTLKTGERDRDITHLVVNATMTLLENPGADFDDVVEDNYSVTPAEVKQWWDGWS